jgi:hypothetical protein
MNSNIFEELYAFKPIFKPNPKIERPNCTMIADIESPYMSVDPDIVKRNILYARIACSYALRNGYTPFASHLFFTQPGLLDDNIPAERSLGINAGKDIIRMSATVSIFFLDLGESTGMKYGREYAMRDVRKIIEIKLFDKDISHMTYDQLLELAIKSKLIKDDYTRIGW